MPTTHAISLSLFLTLYNVFTGAVFASVWIFFSDVFFRSIDQYPSDPVSPICIPLVSLTLVGGAGWIAHGVAELVASHTVAHMSVTQ